MLSKRLRVDDLALLQSSLSPVLFDLSISSLSQLTNVD